jgi:hypothetical protein
MLLDLFRWLELNLPGGVYLRESTYGFSVLITVHVVALGIFLGLIVMMDLRLVGVANLRSPASEVQARLFPWQMVGFTIIVLSGLLLFWSQPLRYYGKTFFWCKMGLMVLAGVNAGIIHTITHRSEAAWDSRAARIAGAASLVLWAGVLTFGRLLAYEWMTTEHLVE